MEILFQVSMWLGIATGVVAVTSFIVGLIRWAFSIHQLGTDMLKAMQEIANMAVTVAALKKNQRKIKLTVDTHDKILAEHGNVLDNHTNKLKILVGQ